MPCSIEKYQHLYNIFETSMNNIHDDSTKLSNIANIKFYLKKYNDLDLVFYSEINNSKRLIGLKSGFNINMESCDGINHQCTLANADNSNLDIFEYDDRGNITENRLVQSITIKNTDYLRIVRGKTLEEIDFNILSSNEGEYPLGLFYLTLEDEITNLEISNNASLITAEVSLLPSFTPSIYKDPSDNRARNLFSVTYKLTRDGGEIPFVVGSKIIGYGSYVFTASISEMDIPTNNRTFTIRFILKREITDMTKLEIEYKNAYNQEDIEDKGVYIEGEDILQPVIKTTIPNDLEITDQTMYYDGALMDYNEAIDTITVKGNYSMNTTIRRKSNINSNLPVNSKNYSLTFTMKEGNANVASSIVRCINTIDNANIPSGETTLIIYKDQQVCLDYEEPEMIYIKEAIMKFTPQPSEENPSPQESILDDFVRGESVYEEYGDYSLTLILGLLDDENYIPAGEENIRVYKFRITYGEVPIEQDKIVFREILSGRELGDGNITFYDQAAPSACYLLDDNISFVKNITLTKNGETVSTFNNGDTLTELGAYTITMTVTDARVESNSVTKSATFEIRTSPLDLYDKEINIINKLNNNPVTNGQIIDVYLDELGNHISPIQLTWNSIEGATESYTLQYNNNLTGNFVKGNNLSQIGAYRLHVEFTDPVYSKNKIVKDLVFELRLNLDDMRVDPNLSAYLNGVPYQIGTVIDKPGSYHLLAVRRQESNFNYSKKEVNFTVIDSSTLQKPLINTHPEESISDKVRVQIVFPSYATIREYRINNEGWIPYDIPFDLTKNCTIYARCKDTINNFYAESSRAVNNIDDQRPDPPEILGFYKENNIYHSVTPMVKYIYGLTYTCLLDGKPFVLGDAIYNNQPQIVQHSLTIKCTKKTNGLSNETSINFTIDSIPPDYPIVTNVIENQMQDAVTPTVSNMDNTCDYECYLNDKSYILGTPINKPGSYKLSVTAIKKSNGLRRTKVITFIISSADVTLITNRVALLPLRIENVQYASDHELLVNINTGDIYVYVDGQLISKTVELRERKNNVYTSIEEVSIDLRKSLARVEALDSIKGNVHTNIIFLNEKIYEMNTDMDVVIEQADKFLFDNYEELEERRKELVEITKLNDRNAIELENINSLLIGKVDTLKDMITRIQNNADGVAELAYYKSILPTNKGGN